MPLLFALFSGSGTSSPTRSSVVFITIMSGFEFLAHTATIAFFIPRCLAIFLAHALSQDHFAERSSMTCAAS